MGAVLLNHESVFRGMGFNFRASVQLAALIVSSLSAASLARGAGLPMAGRHRH